MTVSEKQGLVLTNERETKRVKRLHINEGCAENSGNLTICVCNEAGGLFGAQVSGALWVVGIRLCGIGKVAERRKALKFEEKRKVMKAEEVINMLPLDVGRWWDKGEGWSRGALHFIP